MKDYCIKLCDAKKNSTENENCTHIAELLKILPNYASHFNTCLSEYYFDMPTNHCKPCFFSCLSCTGSTYDSCVICKENRGS